MTTEHADADDWLAALQRLQRSASPHWFESLLKPFGDAPPGATSAADSAQHSAAAWAQFFELGKALLEQVGSGTAASSPEGFSAALMSWQLQLHSKLSAALGHGPWHAAMQAPLPGLGPLADRTLALQRLQELQARAQQLQAQLFQHLTTSLRKASITFAERAAQAAQNEAHPPTLQGLYDLWIVCAEDAYAACVHGEEYCRVQAALANTANALKAEQRSQVEQFAMLFDLPTRAETNALIQRIGALEAELERVKRQQSAPRPRRRATQSTKVRK